MVGRSPDARLVRRAAGGDRDAFGELVERHRDRVWAIALRMCRDPDDAEDVLQETFLAAWRSIGRFGGRSALSTWLYRIAVNTSYDVLARRRPAAALDAVAEPAAPVDRVEQSAQRRAIEDALAGLPEEFRAIAVLCDVLGLTPGEAAEVLEIPEGTAKSRLFRARAAVARALAPEFRPATSGTDGQR
jgi:RNA polymerase sigma-70 factor (ECF subfamily)